MTAMKLKLVLCFLFGLCSAASATSDFQANFTVKPGARSYPYAGRANVIQNGQEITICADDWDINDAEVACREMGLGFVHGITVSGVSQIPSSATQCLNSVKCYGHEERLYDCEFDEPRFASRGSSNNDKGIVCYGPPSEAGVRLRYGPDQYSGYVEVKLASGSWDELYGYYYGYWYLYDYISNIYRQLGFGELNWWDSYELISTYSMTRVSSCPYGVAYL